MMSICQTKSKRKQIILIDQNKRYQYCYLTYIKMRHVYLFK